MKDCFSSLMFPSARFALPELVRWGVLSKTEVASGCFVQFRGLRAAVVHFSSSCPGVDGLSWRTGGFVGQKLLFGALSCERVARVSVECCPSCVAFVLQPFVDGEAVEGFLSTAVGRLDGHVRLFLAVCSWVRVVSAKGVPSYAGAVLRAYESALAAEVEAAGVRTLGLWAPLLTEFDRCRAQLNACSVPGFVGDTVWVAVELPWLWELFSFTQATFRAVSLVPRMCGDFVASGAEGVWCARVADSYISDHGRAVVLAPGGVASADVVDALRVFGVPSRSDCGFSDKVAALAAAKKV